ncbi:MAG TPA: alpha/beta hydrolase [Burkholderiales bacterium]|nr:alpha/beta hydrolase [Burkholderiales bacterium]
MDGTIAMALKLRPFFSIRNFLLVALLALTAPVLAGEYASVNGLKMYYEVEGHGRPLVLLHSGLCTIEVCFGKLRPAFTKSWRTIAPELQGHGRTADIDRPLSMDQMTEDVAALLRQLKVQNADFFGASIGGGIALRLALKYPELVHKAVIFGVQYNNDGLIPGLIEKLKALKAEDVPPQFREGYAKVAPDPTKFPALVAKLDAMVLGEKGFSPEEIKSIKAPILVMIGDTDFVRPEHAVEMYRLLPHGQLAVLPLSTHFAPMDRPQWVASMTRAFLTAPMPNPKDSKP